MNDDRGLPPYPPERNAWDYPPPAISRRWIWAPIAAVVAAAMAATALVISAVVIMGKDFPGMIEDSQIISVIERECDIMTETVRSMPIEGTASEQADIVADQNKAVANMLIEIRKLDDDVLKGDPPTNAWLDDWDALIVAREAYAEQRRDGYEANLRIPRDADGEQIQQRMDVVWLTTPACEVPEELLRPYPEDVSEI